MAKKKVAKKAGRPKTTDPKILTIKKTISLNELNYCNLTDVIKRLQDLANEDFCDPDRSTIEIEYEHGYYEEVYTNIKLHCEYQRPETEKEVRDRVEKARKIREGKKLEREKKRAQELELRDRLLDKYPLDTVPPVMDKVSNQ